jgi:hypothetical protein
VVPRGRCIWGMGSHRPGARDLVKGMSARPAFDLHSGCMPYEIGCVRCEVKRTTAGRFRHCPRRGSRNLTGQICPAVDYGFQLSRSAAH